MKTFYRAIAIAAAIITTPASAADLYGRAPGPAYAAAPFSGYNWNGAYVGANLGYQWGKVVNWGNAAPSGVMGGGQVGYNWQSGWFVFGVEADIQASGANDTFAAYKFSNPWFGTLRGRAGYAMNNVLFYGTGGLAYGGARVEAQRLGTEFLGEVPLLLDIRTASDAGTPIAASAPESEGAKAFAAVAARVWEKVSGAGVVRASGPRIVVE